MITIEQYRQCQELQEAIAVRAREILEGYRDEVRQNHSDMGWARGAPYLYFDSIDEDAIYYEGTEYGSYQYILSTCRRSTSIPYLGGKT